MNIETIEFINNMLIDEKKILNEDLVTVKYEDGREEERTSEESKFSFLADSYCHIMDYLNFSPAKVRIAKVKIKTKSFEREMGYLYTSINEINKYIKVINSCKNNGAISNYLIKKLSKLTCEEIDKLLHSELKQTLSKIWGKYE